MTMALMVKNKFCFVDGSMKRPNDDAGDELQQWIRCDNLVKTWILSSISKVSKAYSSLPLWNYEGGVILSRNTENHKVSHGIN